MGNPLYIVARVDGVAVRVRRRSHGLLLLLILLMSPLLGACDTFFFQPDEVLYDTPEHYGLWHEQVYFQSGDGTRLSGWFIPARGKAFGTVVHFHGNAANISNHLYAVRWMPFSGYNVFLFDYRGYGRSEGTATREGAIEDGVAAIRYVRARRGLDPARLVLYGQSLGGAIGLSSLARAGTDGFKAVVVEASFLSYRDIVRRIMDRTWFLWPFQYPVAYLGFTDSLSPRDDLPALQAMPLLVVHGDVDRVIPIEAGKALYEAFPGPDKSFWPIPGADHLGVFSPGASPWRESLLAWLGAKLGPVR